MSSGNTARSSPDAGRRCLSRRERSDRREAAAGPGPGEALVGNVNSCPAHFEAAAEVLAARPRRLLDGPVSGVYPPASAAGALDDAPKPVVMFDC